MDSHPVEGFGIPLQQQNIFYGHLVVLRINYEVQAQVWISDCQLLYAPNCLWNEFCSLFSLFITVDLIPSLSELYIYGQKWVDWQLEWKAGKMQQFRFQCCNSMTWYSPKYQDKPFFIESNCTQDSEYVQLFWAAGTAKKVLVQNVLCLNIIEHHNWSSQFL